MFFVWVFVLFGLLFCCFVVCLLTVKAASNVFGSHFISHVYFKSTSHIVDPHPFWNCPIRSHYDRTMFFVKEIKK